jgi:cytochrome b561/polyisoprenoid-binding protein YceI
MTEARYTLTAKLLHWIVAGLIVLQFILAELAEDAATPLRELALLANHKSVGITIMLLAATRLLWRLFNRPPPLPDHMPRWQVTASQLSHWSLYALLFLMPVTGWLMSSASAYSVSWFNLFQLPDLIGPDPDTEELFEEIHESLAWLLVAVATVHVVAALKHAVLDRDGVFRRMTSGAMIGLFIATIGVGAWSLGTPGRAASVPDSTVKQQGTRSNATDAAPDSGNGGGPALPAWDIDFTDSYIRFTAYQSGASFDGSWKEWTADIRFSGAALDASSFDVKIETAQVETNDDDRDSTLADAEWFDPANHPYARYVAKRFSANEDGSYTAHGELTIKGTTQPVDLDFSVASEGDQRVLTGSAELLRLDFGVGTGEWEDTTWVRNEVSVTVRVSARGLR